jgi:hypothetical protein
MGHVLEEDRPLPDGWDARVAAGLAVYRNAYRARLIDALAETFPRTQQWLGKEIFDAAAAHHLIVHPPTSWTLDMAGDGFVETLAELFVSDPEVPDLAWLEWAMHLAFTAGDCEPLDAASFAASTVGFDEDDWADMRLTFVPSAHVREVRSDCAALWQALRRDEAPAAAPMLDNPLHCLVWREGLAPVFTLVPEIEGTTIASMRDGASFGDICASLAGSKPADEAAHAAGAMLGQWLARGLVAEVIPGREIRR